MTLHSISPLRTFADEHGVIQSASIYGRRKKLDVAVPLLTLTLRNLPKEDRERIVAAFDDAIRPILARPNDYAEPCVGGVCPLP